jgi:hypothetical protein
MEDVGILYVLPFTIFTAIWYIVRPFGILCGHLVHFMAILYTFGHLVHFPVLVNCTKKNLATLISSLPSSGVTFARI